MDKAAEQSAAGQARPKKARSDDNPKPPHPAFDRWIEAKSKGEKTPHLVAALAHGIGAVLGQVAVDKKPDEKPAVRELLKAFADVAGRSSR